MNKEQKFVNSLLEKRIRNVITPGVIALIFDKCSYNKSYNVIICIKELIKNDIRWFELAKNIALNSEIKYNFLTDEFREKLDKLSILQ